MSNRAHPVDLAVCSLLLGLLFSVYALVKLGFFNGKTIDSLHSIPPQDNVCCMDYFDTGN
jgi:hypothetical protein